VSISGGEVDLDKRFLWKPLCKSRWWPVGCDNGNPIKRRFLHQDRWFLDPTREVGLWGRENHRLRSQGCPIKVVINSVLTNPEVRHPEKWRCRDPRPDRRHDVTSRLKALQLNLEAAIQLRLRNASGSRAYQQNSRRNSWEPILRTASGRAQPCSILNRYRQLVNPFSTCSSPPRPEAKQKCRPHGGSSACLPPRRPGFCYAPDLAPGPGPLSPSRSRGNHSHNIPMPYHHLHRSTRGVFLDITPLLPSGPLTPVYPPHTHPVASPISSPVSWLWFTAPTQPSTCKAWSRQTCTCQGAGAWCVPTGDIMLRC